MLDSGWIEETEGGETVTYDDDPSGPDLAKGETCGAGACRGLYNAASLLNVAFMVARHLGNDICRGIAPDFTVCYFKFFHNTLLYNPNN